MTWRTHARTTTWLFAVIVMVGAASWAGQSAQAGSGTQTSGSVPNAPGPLAVVADPISGRLAFVRGAQTGIRLFSIGADGRGLRRLTSGRDRRPAWSRDGSRLAFERTRDGGRTIEIYVASATGAHPRAITHAGGFAQSPSWAPNGSLIVFNASGGRFGQSTDPSCLPNLWVVRPNGLGLRRLVRAGVQPAYSPDGRRIAFVRPDAREIPWLYVVSSTGRGLRRVGIGSDPSWSPDGRRLVIERPIGPNRIADLWVVRVSDWRATRLTRTATVAELGPTWSPDGRWIAFSAVVRDQENIYALPSPAARAAPSPTLGDEPATTTPPGSQPGKHGLCNRGSPLCVSSRSFC